MSRLRHSAIALAVLSLLGAVPALVAAPLGAQSNDERPPPAELFIFSNEMTNPDADNDGAPDRRWQARITVAALGSCVPRSGLGAYDSFWLDADEEVAARLSLTECVFRISARVRVESSPDCEYRAQIAWRDDDDALVGDYHDGSVLTSERPDDESRISARRDPDSGCTRPHRTYFLIGGDAMVQELPGAIPDEALLARARRAAAVGEYTVRVEPDTAVPAAGCDIAGEFVLQGDEATSAQQLGATGQSCPSRATIVDAPPYVSVSRGHVAFDAALPNIIVDLTPLVRIAASRIAIVQDAVGSANQGQVRYSVTRSCGGAAVPSPVAQASSVDLFEGRFTVHSPDVPQFGPVGMYRAVATTTGSTTVVGCAVTVTVSGVPAGCAVVGGDSQTVAWFAASTFTNFDFEFDFYCGDATPPSSEVPAPPSTPEVVGESGAEDMLPTEGADDMAPVADSGPTVDEGDDAGALDATEATPAHVGPPRDAPTG
ncbi:MAG: hypothetical protein F4X37_09905 [Acidimicrobiia bacterium]|nr:hypothetical protein [Acidimicrobiia bacterium]